MTAPVRPQAASSTRQPQPTGVIVCSSQRSGLSAVAMASVSRDLAGLAVRAALAEADDDAAAAADAEEAGDAAAGEVNAPARPAGPGRTGREELCDVV